MRLLISFLRFFVVTSIYFSACDGVAENELAATVDGARKMSLGKFAEQAFGESTSLLDAAAR